MFRYFALIWNDMDPAATASASAIAARLKTHLSAWECRLDGDGLALFQAGARPRSSEMRLLTHEAGAVAGRLFVREREGTPATRPVVLDEHETREIVRSAGRHILDKYWGRYVAFVRDAQSGTVSIVRDPSGALPCFTTTLRGVTLCYSRLEDCLALGLANFSVNSKYLAAYVCFSAVQTSETGLNEVSELQAGECLQIRDDGTSRRTLYWDPVSICKSEQIEDIEVATRALRETTSACVWAWASCYPNIIHLLSGGLDSSIVLHCLRSAPSMPKVTCLNYFEASPDADERPFARLMAKSAGCPLVEAETRASEMRLDALLSVPRLPKPLSYDYFLRHGRQQADLAQETGASAVFQGAGGDQLFYQWPLQLAAADYVRQHGLGMDFVRIALDIARTQRLSFWSVLRVALLEGWLRPRWNPMVEVGKYRRLVNREVISAAQRDVTLVHPWLRNAAGIPSGKLRHVLVMAISPDFYNPMGRDDQPEPVLPLVSQPLMELCLRVPTYVLTTGGMDRAIARHAFRPHLPREIFSRRTKGGIDWYMQKVLVANRDFLREMFLDGLLVKERLLDRSKLESLLAGRTIKPGAEIGELLAEHLNAEAWLRSWREYRQAAAA